MSFRIKNCISTLSDYTSAAGLTRIKEQNPELHQKENICSKVSEVDRKVSNIDRKLCDVSLKVSNGDRKLCDVECRILGIVSRVSELEVSHKTLHSTIELVTNEQKLVHNRMDIITESDCETTSEKLRQTESDYKTISEKVGIDTIHERLSTLESNHGSGLSKSISDKISLLEKIVSRSAELSESRNNTITNEIRKLQNEPRESVLERVISIEKSLSEIDRRSTNTGSSIGERLTAIEIKISKFDNKPLVDRITSLENKKNKVEIPKSVSDRLSSVETKISETNSLSERVKTIESKPSIPPELLSLIKTLSDRVVSLESDSTKIKNKLDSLTEEEFATVNSPSSTNSNSLVHIK